MRKILIGILVCVLFFGTVLPISGDTINNEHFDETSVKILYFVKIDLTGVGETTDLSTAVNWKISEGNLTTYSFFSVELSYEDVIKADFFKSDTITSPSAGFLFFFKGTIDYDDESGIVEIHGSAIMSVSGPSVE